MKKSYLYFALSVLSLFTILSCSAQKGESDSAHETVTLGRQVSELPDNIWNVFQDHENNYWFGTDGEGVFRYNEKSITQFTSKDGLLSNRIRGIQGDSLGHVYITCLTGVCKYDGQTMSALPVSERNQWELSSNDLWFSILGKTGENGPYRYDGDSLYHLQFPKHPNEESHYAIHGKHTWSPYEPYSIYRDKQGHMWFGTAELGLCRYDGNTIQWLYEEHLTITEGGGSFGIRSIIQDKNDDYWFCNTTYRYDLPKASEQDENDPFLSYSRKSGIENLISPSDKDKVYFMSAAEDQSGNLWLVTFNEGVFKYDGKKVHHFPVIAENKQVELFSIYQDNQGDLWLGSQHDGIFKFDGDSFRKFIL